MSEHLNPTRADRFNDPIEIMWARMGRFTRVSTNLSQGVHWVQKETAPTFPYVQIDPSLITSCLVIDVDKPGAYYAAYDAHVPPPNFITENRLNGHAHLVWMLEKPVLHHAWAKSSPIFKAAAVERGLTRVIGGDTAYVGLITKTPHHRDWRTDVTCRTLYSLSDLADQLPPASLARGNRVTDTFGLGRNCSLFDVLRKTAYRSDVILKFKKDGRSVEYFWKYLTEVTAVHNAQFNHPLGPSEVRAIARSVAKWTWKRFTEEKFSVLQRRRGLLGAKKRWSGHAAAQIAEPWKLVSMSRATWFRKGKPSAPWPPLTNGLEPPSDPRHLRTLVV